MNRTLTAAVALAAGLGMAGLAHAQSSVGPSTAPKPPSPSTPSSQLNAPPTSSAPSGMQIPSTMSPSSGAQSPQASSQTNQGTQDVSPSQIQQAQQQLKQQGLYNGAIDGIVGPETQTALARFQKEQGLPQTAQLDQETLGRLMNGPGADATHNAGGANSGTTRPMAPQYPAGTQNPATSNPSR